MSRERIKAEMEDGSGRFLRVVAVVSLLMVLAGLFVYRTAVTDPRWNASHDEHVLYNNQSR